MFSWMEILIVRFKNKFGKEMILGRWFDTYRGLELSSCIPFQGISSGSVVNNLPANARDARDLDSILVSGRAPGVGNGNLLQYSCLKLPCTEETGRLLSLGSQCDWTSTRTVSLEIQSLSCAVKQVHWKYSCICRKGQRSASWVPGGQICSLWSP